MVQPFSILSYNGNQMSMTVHHTETVLWLELVRLTLGAKCIAILILCQLPKGCILTCLCQFHQ